MLILRYKEIWNICSNFDVVDKLIKQVTYADQEIQNWVLLWIFVCLGDQHQVFFFLYIKMSKIHEKLKF